MMKTKTTKILLTLFLGLFCTGTTINAQLKVGSEQTPHTGAVLDLKTNLNKGLLLPNVALNADLTQFVLDGQADKAAATGMLVYNTNTNIGTGIYVWDGEKWYKASTGATELSGTPKDWLQQFDPNPNSGDGTQANPFKNDCSNNGYPANVFLFLKEGYSFGTISPSDAAVSYLTGYKFGKSASVEVIKDGKIGTVYVTITPCGAVPSQPGAISGPTNVTTGTTSLEYCVNAVAGATGYDWTVPAGWTITSNNSTCITVTAGSASGNITVAAKNAAGSSAVTSLPVTLYNPLIIPDYTEGNYTLIGATCYDVAMTEGGAACGDLSSRTNSFATTLSFPYTLTSSGYSNLAFTYDDPSGIVSGISSTGMITFKGNVRNLARGSGDTGLTVTIHAIFMDGSIQKKLSLPVKVKDCRCCVGYMQPGTNLCWARVSEHTGYATCGNATADSKMSGWRLPSIAEYTTMYNLPNANGPGLGTVGPNMGNQPTSYPGTNSITTGHCPMTQGGLVNVIALNCDQNIAYWDNPLYRDLMQGEYPTGATRCVRAM